MSYSQLYFHILYIQRKRLLSVYLMPYKVFFIFITISLGEKNR